MFSHDKHLLHSCFLSLYLNSFLPTYYLSYSNPPDKNTSIHRIRFYRCLINFIRKSNIRSMCQLKMISQSRLCAVHTEYNVFILLRPGNVNIAQLQLLDRFASPAPISNAFGIFTFVIVSMLRCIYSQAKTGSARRAENVRITDMTTRFSASAASCASPV